MRVPKTLNSVYRNLLLASRNSYYIFLAAPSNFDLYLATLASFTEEALFLEYFVCFS